MCAKWQWNGLDWCYWIALQASLVVQSSNTRSCVPLSFRTHPCVLAMKSPWISGGCIVFGLFPSPPLPPLCQHFSTFQETPEANIFKPHMVNLWVWEKFLVSISVTLGQGHQATEAGQIWLCSHDKVRTAHPIARQVGRYTFLVMLPTWLNFGGILSKTLFLTIFYVKFQMPFSPIEHSICHILGVVGPIDVKQKGHESIGCFAD